MFDWLTESESTLTSANVQQAPGKFHLEKIQVDPIGYLNELALFFFAGSAILSVDMLVNLPIRNAFSRERILCDVAPHFEEVKLIYREDRPESVNMRMLRPQAKKLFAQCRSPFKALVLDLYRTSERPANETFACMRQTSSGSNLSIFPGRRT